MEPSPQRRRVAVAARLRPSFGAELEQNGVWNVDDRQRLVSEVRTGDTWAFDHAFSQDADNAGVFDACCADVVQSFCDGINGTIMTYGQTASGKTHTMYGPDGVIPRAIDETFAMIARSNGYRQYVLTASFLEIYNEQVTDLLSGGEVNTLEGRGGGLVLQHLSQIAVSCCEDVLDAVALGEKRRKVGETSANKRSSRSHTLLLLFLESRAEGEESVRYSQLSLGDLAGSEGLKNVDLTSREQRREGSCINKSLLALTQVVHALSEGGSRMQRVGFRDSKLTRILQPSLGGNAKTVIICTLAAGPASRAESRSTLDFASRARRVENSVSVNIRKDPEQSSQIQALERQLAELRNRVAELQKEKPDELEEADSNVQETSTSLSHVFDSVADHGAADSDTGADLSVENAALKRKIERLEAALHLGCAESSCETMPIAVPVRRRRTIGSTECNRDLKRSTLSATTLAELVVQLPEAAKVGAAPDDTPQSPTKRQKHDSGVGHLPSPNATPAAKDAWAALSRAITSCPRIDQGTAIATPQTVSRLKQPGWRRSERAQTEPFNARCSTPPRARRGSDLQPIAMTFSPMSVSTIAMADCEVSHHSDGLAGISIQQCLVKIPGAAADLDADISAFDTDEVVHLKQELAMLRSELASQTSRVADLTKAKEDVLRLQVTVDSQSEELRRVKEESDELRDFRDRNYAELQQVESLHRNNKDLFTQLCAKDEHLIDLSKDHDRLREAFKEMKEKQDLKDEVSELRRDNSFQSSLVAELQEKASLKDELQKVREENESQAAMIRQLRANEEKHIKEMESLQRSQTSSSSSSTSSTMHERTLEVRKRRSECHRVLSKLAHGCKEMIVDYMMQTAFSCWRLVIADAKAWNAEESKAWMQQCLQRCSCGEKGQWEVRSRGLFDAMKARQRRHAQEDAKDRNPECYALFPAGAGELGTLLEQVKSIESLHT